MISVICPVLNERAFIKAHIENCLKFAGEIFYGDSGCTDGSMDIVRAYQQMFPEKIYILDLTPFVSGPYDWHEGEARNSLIDFCRGEWICNLDADELWAEDFFRWLPRLEKTKKQHIRFSQFAYWMTPHTIRVRQYDTFDHFRHFYPGGRQYRLFRNNGQTRYKEEGNHAPLSFKGMGKWSPRLSYLDLDIPFHHYHWAGGFKTGGDNRSWEANKTGIALNTYFGPMPEEVKYYEWEDE